MVNYDHKKPTPMVMFAQQPVYYVVAKGSHYGKYFEYYFFMYINPSNFVFLSKLRSICNFKVTSPPSGVFSLKYSLVGHSCVQEVDCMYKQIEDAMHVAEFYSPISFLRVLIEVNRKKPYRVIQMGQSDFKDYMNASKLLQFSLIPYTKVYQWKRLV